MSLINKKGLCKILKATYRRGYELMPSGSLLTLNGRSWAIQCPTVDLPVEAAVQVVENVGYMPVEAIFIQAGAPNQIIMPETAQLRSNFFRHADQEVFMMKKIPVIYKDRWQLYQTETGQVYGFDTELMQMIDFKTVDPTAIMVAQSSMGIWFWADMAIFIAPGHFSAEDSEKLHHIAALDWEHQQDHDDPAANMSLFDDEDEPLMDKND